MRKSIPVLLMAVAAFSLWGCQKEMSYEKGSGSSATGKLRAKIDGVQWVADASASATILAGEIAIDGISVDNKELYIQLGGDSVSTYNLDQQSQGFAIWGDSTSASDPWSTDQGQSAADAGGSVIVTSIDTVNKTISGTFTFKVYRDSDSTHFDVTEGVFDQIPYTATLPPASGGDTLSAKIDGTFWAAESITSLVYGEQLAISGATSDLSKSIILSMPRTVVPGTYALSVANGGYYGVYSVGAVSLTSDSGTLTITAHNTTTKQITGSFSFSASDPLGGGGSAALTEGYFSVTYQ